MGGRTRKIEIILIWELVIDPSGSRLILVLNFLVKSLILEKIDKLSKTIINNSIT